MKKILIGLVCVLIFGNAWSQNNIGIGITTPGSKLHINGSVGYFRALQISNSATGVDSIDGLQFSLTAIGDASILQHEARALRLGTAGTSSFIIKSNGDIGINTETILGASDLTLRSNNSSSWGGMYIESVDASGGRPFYGYAINGGSTTWHYYDVSSGSWRLYVNGDRMAVLNDGRVGIGTMTPHSSAILDLNSVNRGLLPPRMNTSQRQAIVAPAQGLMVYDTTLSDIYLYKGAGWNTLGGSVWTEDNNPIGVFYNGGNVAIGQEAQVFHRFYVKSGTENPINARFVSTYSGGLATYGVLSEVPGNGTGTRYGIYGRSVAASGDGSPAYGVYGLGSANNGAAKIYGVYGLVTGTTGTGTMYGVYGFANGANNYAIYGKANHVDALAGYFEGELRVGATEAAVSTINIDPSGQSSAGTIDMFDNDGTKTVMIRANQNTAQGAEILMANEEGNVTLELDSDSGTLSAGFISIKDSASATRISMWASEASNQGAAIYLYDASNTKTIELDADFGGKGRVITQELEITGGSDLAEYFELASGHPIIQAGRVVSIDPNTEGSVCISKTAYDKTVIGIVSGANGINSGMFMGQRESIAFGNVPIAIAGRVYVKVDEAKYKIHPGDFLTSSDIPGVAMRVKNIRKARGAIIGKALTEADEAGFVLVLVNLQ